MLAKLALSVACVLAIIGSSAAQDQLRLDDSTGETQNTASLGTNSGDSATVSSGNCTAVWTRADSERVSCIYQLPATLPAVPGGGSVYNIVADNATNGIFDGTVTPGCQNSIVQTVINAGSPSLTDALEKDCTGTAGGSASTRNLCFDGTSELIRC